MNNFNCVCKTNCGGLSAVASIIVGIITAFLTITGYIAVTDSFLWVTFGIAVVYLLAVFIVSSANNKSCTCNTLPLFLTGAYGTILTSVILLAITFANGSVPGAIIKGALLMFLTLTFASTGCLAKCGSGCSNE